jgi:P27 family predicted phage terminase small subunit
MAQPPGMTAEAATLWREFAPRHEASGNAQPEDATMLSAYCEAVAAANRVRSGLRAPIVTTTSGAVRVSPALAAWRESTMAALKLAEHFGWTPLARARMKADVDPTTEPAESEGASLYGTGTG